MQRFPLTILLLVSFGAIASAEPPLRQQAALLLAALPGDQQDDATWPFDDDEREDVHFAPFWLDGVAHRDLDPRSASLVESLLATALSARGHETVRSVRDLERAVRAQESGILSFFLPDFRDPGRYLLAVFGEPGSGEPWGFRYEGHHLSLNVTDVSGSPLVTTPLFLGAQPRVVPEGLPSAGVAVLGREEHLARTLYATLPTPLRERATLGYDGGRDLMLGQVRRVGRGGAPAGVPRGEMPPDARVLLDELVERFVGLWNEPTARARRAEIEAAGRDSLHFAFAAADEPPNAFYVRIHGPRLLIEIDNTTDGDHLHAVWHDPENDFADDALALHWRLQHGVAITGTFRRSRERAPRQESGAGAYAVRSFSAQTSGSRTFNPSSM